MRKASIVIAVVAFVLIAATPVAVAFLGHPAMGSMWRDVWHYNRLAIEEAVGLFAIMPVVFLVIVALDRRGWHNADRRKVER